MDVILRPGRPEDANACGVIVFEAFKSIAGQHNFPLDIPSAEIGIGLVKRRLSHPGYYSLIAEKDGDVVGSLFLDERGSIAAISPLTIDPAAQNHGVGRALMLKALERVVDRGFAGVRLVQSAYHYRALCLYATLGFRARETLSKMHGTPLGLTYPGYDVRPATLSDLVACNALCRRIHGHDRDGELQDAITQGTARVVEHLGTITAYATDIAFFAHAVAESNQCLKALIGGASGFGGGGFLLPTRNGALFSWALQNGLRLVHQMNLMTTGLYNEPAGAYLPSVAY
jgi:predicted N-acetyltransferase YhbS